MTSSHSTSVEPFAEPLPQKHQYPRPRSGLLIEKLLQACDGLATWTRRATRIAPHLDLGMRGEEAAFFHLRRLGFVIVARRWHSYRHRGDLDLIAWEGKTLCFIEVKTRSSHAVAAAETAVDRDKRRTLRRLAWHYLRYLPTSSAESRFDILTVYTEDPQRPQFHLFRSAFGWSELEDRSHD